jgi:hypothetical protein
MVFLIQILFFGSLLIFTGSMVIIKSYQLFKIEEIEKETRG